MTNLVEKDEMTKLRTASESRETSLTAADDVQMMSIAYAINSAANTGATRVTYVEEITEANLEILKTKGYSITYNNNLRPKGQTIISWS